MKMPMVSACAFAIVAALLLGRTASAGEVQGEESLIAAVSRATALETVDGELLGIGPDYKAAFTPEGFLYTTRLGPTAPHSGTLAFALESIRCGDTTLLRAAAPVRPSGAGRTVTYAHGTSIRERYHVRADGLEQTFVFDELPAGRGELVVRGRVDTDLVARGLDGSPAAGTHIDGLRFESPGYGSFVYGGVTGIDAEGRTARGELRFDGEWLELVLPAAFVADAALPLTLDPLLGANTVVASGILNQIGPDIAFDVTHQVYLVAWFVSFSGFDGDTYAQRVAPDGSLVGSLLVVEGNTNLTSDGPPTVVNNNGPSRFLVAWRQSPSAVGGSNDLVCRLVNASDGGLSNSLIFAIDATYPEGGGEVLEGYSHVHVVWAEDGGIRGAALAVPSSGDVASVTPYVIAATSAQVGSPAISKSGGSPGRYLVTWTDHSAPGQLPRILARTVDYTGAVGPPPIAVSVEPIAADDLSAVDGDGTDFAVVFERLTPTAGGPVEDLVCRKVHWTGSDLSAQPGTTVIASGDPIDSHGADVVMVGGSFLSGGSGVKYAVAWHARVGSAEFAVRYKELDPADCSECSATVTLASGAGEFHVSPSLASELGGGGSGASDRGMAVTQLHGSGTDDSIWVRPFEALGAGGPVVDLGGGCAGGGTASTVGPFAIGNAGFRFELSGAAPAAAIALHNFSVATPHFACGPCSGFIGILQAVAVTDGAASFTLPIPCDPFLLGVPIDQNWIVIGVPTTHCPTFAGIANSNNLRLTLGE